MGNEAELTAWQEVGAVRSLVSVAPATRLPVSQREADTLDLVPVNREEFIPVLLPCLQLVAPVGMGLEEQDLWFEAAYKALDGIPIALLKRGAEAAMRKADHPAKIVPAIHAEIGETWNWRKTVKPRPMPALPAPVETDDERREREEVAKLMGDLAKKLSMAKGPW
jgi:hypothetical protein